MPGLLTFILYILSILVNFFSVARCCRQSSPWHISRRITEEVDYLVVEQKDRERTVQGALLDFRHRGPVQLEHFGNLALRQTRELASLEAVLRATASEVDATLQRLLPSSPGLHARVQEAMRYAVLVGGKRLRPFLVLKSSDTKSADTKPSDAKR